MGLWIFAAVLSSFIKGITGFADALIFTTIMTATETNAAITPVQTLVSYPSNFILLYRYRRHVNRSILLPAASLMALGCVAGAFILKNVDTTLLKVIFGFFIIFISIKNVVETRGNMARKENRRQDVVYILLAGVLSGTFGIGILMAAYLEKATKSVEEFKANLAAVFIVSSSIKMVVYTMTGILTLETVRRAAILYPCMLVTLFLGMKVGDKSNRKYLQMLINSLLFLGGVSMIVTNLGKLNI